MTEIPAPRPGVVTFLVVVSFIGGALQVMNGVILVFARSELATQRSLGVGPNTVFWTGIGSIVGGLVVLLVAKGLANGNGFARFLVGFVTFVNLVVGLYRAVATTGGDRVVGVFAVAFALLLLMLLYSKRSNEFFRSN